MQNEQTIEQRLIDEAIAHEPVKNTFRLAKEFMVLNKQFTLTAMSMLLLLNILSAFLGLLAMVLSGVFTMAIQIYVSRLLYNAKDINEFITQSRESKVEKVLAQHALSGTGAYLGFVTLFLAILLLMVFLLQSQGFDMERVTSVEELILTVSSVALPVLFLILLLSYVNPLVQANIALARDFKEGYLAVFTFFSANLWRQAFNKSYFKYIILVLSIVFILAVVFGMLMTLPGIKLLANFFLIVLMYVYMIVMSMVAMFARRVVEV